MKKIFSILSLTTIALAMMAQSPIITFEKTEHDFGKINEADGRVTTVFTFKNEGMEPLVLSNVRASCGCTTPKWTREPIEPGQKGNITVTYNPNGRPGRFQKTVTVTSNASEQTKRLIIKGEVIPKPAKPINNYAYKMGPLSLRQKEVNFGNVDEKTSKTLEIEYANLTDQLIRVQLLEQNGHNPALAGVASLDSVKPGQTGKFQIHLESSQSTLWGPIEAKYLVVLDGKKENNSEFEITAKAFVEEDFSKLTDEERHNAPIMDVTHEINFGKLNGKVSKRQISVANVGLKTPLEIRRILNTNSEIKVSVNKTVVKAGKEASLRLELNPIGMEPGTYKRQMTLLTNDPNQTKVVLTILWVVE